MYKHNSWRLAKHVITASLVSALCACGKETAYRRLVLTCASPDNAHVAEFYIESGGGAAGWQEELVAVRNPAGSQSTVVLRMNRGYDAILSWRSNLTLDIYYPDTARVDHWQNEFDYRLTGSQFSVWTNDLIKLPSKSGSFVSEKSHCGPPPRQAIKNPN